MAVQYKQIIDTLTWFDQMGVDEVVGEQPINHLSRNDNQTQEATPAPKASATPITEQSRPKREISAELQSPESLILHSQSLAEKATSLTELKASVHDFNGLSICKTATNTVFSDGNPEAEIMFIGEAPGADEDMQGIPFCGASGKLLEQMLNAIGLYRSKNYYISNTVFWRPPGNRKPTPHELAVCLPLVEKHIALVNPKVIVLIGGTAITSLLNTKQGITKMRGEFQEYTNPFIEGSIPITPIFHPSYLLRSPGQKKFAWHDLLTLDAFLEKKGIAK